MRRFVAFWPVIFCFLWVSCDKELAEGELLAQEQIETEHTPLQLNIPHFDPSLEGLYRESLSTVEGVFRSNAVGVLGQLLPREQWLIEPWVLAVESRASMHKQELYHEGELQHRIYRTYQGDQVRSEAVYMEQGTLLKTILFYNRQEFPYKECLFRRVWEQEGEQDIAPNEDEQGDEQIRVILALQDSSWFRTQKLTGIVTSLQKVQLQVCHNYHYEGDLLLSYDSQLYQDPSKEQEFPHSSLIKGQATNFFIYLKEGLLYQLTNHTPSASAEEQVPADQRKEAWFVQESQLKEHWVEEQEGEDSRWLRFIYNADNQLEEQQTYEQQDLHTTTTYEYNLQGQLVFSRSYEWGTQREDLRWYDQDDLVKRELYQEAILMREETRSYVDQRLMEEKIQGPSLTLRTQYLYEEDPPHRLLQTLHYEANRLLKRVEYFLEGDQEVHTYYLNNAVVAQLSFLQGRLIHEQGLNSAVDGALP